MSSPNDRMKTMRGQLVTYRWQSSPGLYAPSRHRRPCNYEAFVPEPLTGNVPALEPALAGTIADAEAAIRALNVAAQPALQPLARLLLRTESIASSRVEGLQVDARTLARAEARAETGRSPGSVVGEILANVDAMQLAIEQAAGGVLSLDRIVAIHRALLEHGPNARIAGQVRDGQNWIGGNDYNPCGADFVPPPPENLERLLADLVDFANDDSLPPLVQAALAHAQFETIHPFADGNGRTGRALVQVILRRRGVAPSYVPPISVVLAADRSRYIAGLTDFRHGREAKWLEQFAAATAQAAGLASGYLGELETLRQAWRAALASSAAPRADAAAWALIDALAAHPHITVSIGAAATGRSRPAVAQAIEQLVKAGVLAPLGTGRRNRSWEADGLLTLLASLESGEPIAAALTDSARGAS